MSVVRANRVLRILVIAVACAAVTTILIRWLGIQPAAPIALSPESPERQVTLLLNEAEQASDSGDLATAERLFQEALHLDPGNSKALIYSAGLRQQSGDLPTAKVLLAKVGDTPVTFGATARFLEGTIALTEHNSSRAESLFLKAQRLNPSYQPPLRELARLYALQLRGDELTQVLDDLAVLRPLKFEELAMGLLAGQPYVERSQAMQILTQMSANDPANIHNVLAQVRYLLQEGDSISAESLLESIATPVSKDSALQSALALAWDMNGNGPSLNQSDIELTFNPATTREAWELASRRASAAGDWPMAVRIDEFRLSREPFSPAVSHSLATAFERLQKPEQAMAQHQQTERLDQLELLAYRMMNPRAQVPDVGIPVACEIADLLKAAGFRAHAIRWLIAAEALSPGRPDVRARLQALNPEPGDAATTTTKAVPVIPNITIRLQDRPANSKVDDSDTEWQFRDVASELGIQFEYCNGKSPYKRIIETIGGGAAVLDIDGDNWPDLYFPQGKSTQTSSALLNDQLFRNQRGQRFTETTDAAGIREFEHSLSATVADYDNDGFADVFVTNVGSCRLFHNNGDGTFLDATPLAVYKNSDCSSCACFVDLNQDSLLDVFVVNYVADWERRCTNQAGEFATCHPHEFQLAQNRLYQNLGNGEFSDVTNSSGLLGITGRGLGVIAADFNHDGQTDIFVANDGTPNNLLQRNRSEIADSSAIRLSDIALQCGAAVPSNGRSHAGMGIAMADFDQNGFQDLFVTNFYREQNTLYSGIGPDLFVDNSQQSGIGPPSLELLGFGTQALDVNSDGYDDLVVMNGDIDDYSATGRRWKMPMSVFRGGGGGRFLDKSDHCGPEVLLPQLGRGLTRIDFDGDQISDLVAVRHDGAVRLLHNKTTPTHDCIHIRLISCRDSRDAIGLQVRMESGENDQIRAVTSGDGFSASNERVLSFAAPKQEEYQFQVVTGGTALLQNDGYFTSRDTVMVVVLQQDGTCKAWGITK